MGSTTVAALLPGFLTLVRMREEGERSSRIAGAIDEGYGRVGRGGEEVGY